MDVPVLQKISQGLFSLDSLISKLPHKSTCARMDVPVLDKAARGLCITSCSMQNCGTGYCQKRSGRPTCVCSRCANGGGNIPLDSLIKRGKH
ncbi:hypothetical protein CAEBREN_15906 [Caenorhabditis brenneri]|uniref:Uncharacterized protein n=1 Tax=Caenorhabditis brenneri TaxID=135651 RepID=G0PE12_CAEBE|nr:hypothetical protein CAEBREN_15906 [Caenorhabditis brenneri]